jgi:hypothetical protein
MVLFSIGLPSRFTEWCDGVTAGLAARSFGAAGSVAVNTLEEFAAAVLRSRAPYLVVCSRQPVLRLQTEIVQGEQPFLVVCGDPRAAVRHLVEGAGQDLTEATRAVASSCAAMRMLMMAPNALVLSDSELADPAETARAIADHFGFAVDRHEISEVLAELAAAGLAPGRDEAAAWQDALGEREQAIVNGALQPYAAPLAASSDLEPLIWERELFFIFEDPPAPTPVPATRPVDITGRARVLIYGPSVNLPPGNWSADIVLGFSVETAGMSFMIDVYAGRQLTYTRLESTGAHVTEVSVHFVIESTLDQRIEVRVLSERAAFDGRLALGQVTLRPQPTVRSETQNYLTHILRA